ncbi:AbrB/MazE/SpoVT family DNA-binding domain-containing protein [Salinirubellus sp. GCM10025818]|uniref:AbrB/MazE/SpoVT family DNA-binding domain-containing protein n=1 Tax=Salinirubellus TaxID=2162630 RepID=UPI0030CF969D
MATDESTITENYAATIPASVRERLDVQPGDKLRWTATDEGDLRVEIVRQREGALDDFEPEPMGGDGTTAHDLMGAER